MAHTQQHLQVFNARFITRKLFTLGGRLPYSRKLELEADYIGLMLLAKTCHYDPGAAPAVFATVCMYICIYHMIAFM